MKMKRLIKTKSDIKDKLINLFPNSEISYNKEKNTISGTISIFDVEKITNFYFIDEEDLYYKWFEKWCSFSSNDMIKIENNIVEDFSFTENDKKDFFESEIEYYDYENTYRKLDTIDNKELEKRMYLAENFVENINIIYNKLQQFIYKIIKGVLKMKRLNKIAIRNIEVYTYEELSEESKKNAVLNFRKYYENSDIPYDYMRMETSDLTTGVLEQITGEFPNSDFKDLYFDWNRAWVVGEIDLDDALKVANLSFNNEESLIFDDMFCYEKQDILNMEEIIYYQPISFTEVIEYVEDIDEYSEKLLESVYNKYIKIVSALQKKIQEINKYFTESMNFYQNPKEYFLIEEIQCREIEFYEDGKIYKNSL